MILSSVLGQAAIADLAIAELLLDDPEGMFDPGARARLEAFEGMDETTHLGAPIALPALAGAHGQLPGDVDALQVLPVLDAGMAGIGVDLCLCPMEQARGRRQVMGIRTRAHHRVDQSGVHIDPDVRLHPEIPLLALAGLVHLLDPARGDDSWSSSAH